jgi:uncharacterized protein
MTLEEKVQAVEGVFSLLDQGISRFQKESGLHCKIGCGKCCFKPEIEATILEFLPFALQLNKQGDAGAWLERLEASTSAICAILDPGQQGVGLCSEYAHRGLICRLFGFSARTNKYAKKELVTCEIIKEEQKSEYEAAVLAVEEERQSIPVMHSYYLQLHSIDFELARDFYPVNVAIRKAIETVLSYYAYRN